MSIKYSCFISYRSPSAELAQEFHSYLESELSHWIPLPIYRDETRLHGGDFYNQELALALCESACMIIIFTPTYFDKISTYCAREYKAMELLEEKRLDTLGFPKNRRHGLIIPVVYRGNTKVPDNIKNKRHFYDFVNWDISGKANLKNPEYKRDINDIAEYIRERYDELCVVEDEISSECNLFNFPSDVEISDWLESMLPPKPKLPGWTEIK